MGETGREAGLLTFSGIAVAVLKVSNCLENLLFVDVDMFRLPEWGGRGEPEDDGVCAKVSKVAKESCNQTISADLL